MKRLFILIITAIAFCSAGHAVKALQVPRQYTQPDGSVITLTLCGDEKFAYYRSAEGLVVVNVGNGYYYADGISTDNTLSSSGILYHNPGSRSATERRKAKAVSTHFSEREMLEKVRRNMASTETRHIGSSEIGSLRVYGSPHVPVLLVQFQDKKFDFDSDEQTLDYYEQYLNGENYKGAGSYGSVRDYFIAQSDSIFSPIFDVNGVVTLDHDYAYYGANKNGQKGNDVRYYLFVEESITKAFNDSVDLSVYDSNADGDVDFVYIIYAGMGEANGGDSNTLWPKELNGMRAVRVGNYSFTSAAMCNELACFGELYMDGAVVHDGIGIMCHELSHALGLPDFYDITYTSFGMDYWDIMDSGCYCGLGFHPCGYTAYERDFMNWRKLGVLSSPSDVTLYPIANSASVGYKVASDASSSEFYVLENRQRVGWDEMLYGHGLMVSHVDYRENSWYYNTVNTDSLHQRMTIIPADGSLGHTSNDLAGDLYPGIEVNTELTDTSAPAAVIYTGDGLMHKPITEITEDSEGVIRFKFMGGESADEVRSISDETVITITEGLLYVSAQGETIELYSLSGTMVFRAVSEAKVSLCPGVYLLKVGKKVRKIVVD